MDMDMKQAKRGTATEDLDDLFFLLGCGCRVPVISTKRLSNESANCLFSTIMMQETGHPNHSDACLLDHLMPKYHRVCSRWGVR